jgi:hypothetical protein
LAKGTSETNKKLELQPKISKFLPPQLLKQRKKQSASGIEQIKIRVLNLKELSNK